jgi:hypothetical protein
MQRGVYGLLVMAIVTSGCGGSDATTDAAPVRAVPREAPGLERLPVLRLAPSRVATAGSIGRNILVRVLIEGRPAGDSLIRTGSVDPACGAHKTDTLVMRSGPAIVGALVWVEGPTAVYATAGTPERRATVTLAGCQLQPRVQVAPPGTMLQLVMRDPRAESLVIVPAPASAPIDTISFLTDGQLVPLRQRADSVGILAVYATGLPWARAFIAVTPPAVSAVTDFNGTVRFTLDATGRAASVRAWHPALGIVSATINPSTLADNATITLTFRP